MKHSKTLKYLKKKRKRKSVIFVFWVTAQPSYGKRDHSVSIYSIRVLSNNNNKKSMDFCTRFLLKQIIEEVNQLQPRVFQRLSQSHALQCSFEVSNFLSKQLNYI